MNGTKLYVLLYLSAFILYGCKTQDAYKIKIAKNAIPCVYMRGGTSKGPFFDMRDLPSNVEDRNKILLKVMGSPDINQIDGLGAVQTVTSKVVMAKPSTRKGIDVDYLFAQVEINTPVVDTTPPCGNMMAGVGPFAIEKGWIKPTSPTTVVKIYNINTNSVIEEIVSTPHGKVEYNGNMRIDGVPGTAAPIIMNLINQDGVKTGKLIPTGNPIDTIDNIPCSIIDAGTIMMLVDAKDIGLTGTENEDFFNKNTYLMQKLENMRKKAGLLAGMGDVSQSVLPKIGILSKPKKENTNITSRYLTPSTLHPSHAVTGAICIGTALKLNGTVASNIGITNGKDNEMIIIEHPSGVIEVNIELERKNNQIKLVKAGTIRTARKIMEGIVYY